MSRCKRPLGFISPRTISNVKITEEEKSNDDNQIARLKVDELNLKQEKVQLENENNRLNSSNEAAFKENTHILLYSSQFVIKNSLLHGEKEKHSNCCLLDCHKIEWKKVAIGLYEYLLNMIIMDDQIYCMKISSFSKLNLETMKTEQLPSMKYRRQICEYSYNNYLVVNDCLWIFGGEDEERKPVKYVEMYNPVTNEWIDKPSLLHERKDAVCATVNDKLFICGGWGLDGCNLHVIEVFDLNSETWTLLDTKIPFDPIVLRVVALDNSLIFHNHKSRKRHWTLNVDTLKWTELSSTSDLVSETELIEIDEKLLHIGAIDDSQQTMYLFDKYQWIKSHNYEIIFFNCGVSLSPTLIDTLNSLVMKE